MDRLEKRLDSKGSTTATWLPPMRGKEHRTTDTKICSGGKIEKNGKTLPASRKDKYKGIQRADTATIHIEIYNGL